MDQSQHGIAVLNRIHDHANSEQVINLIQRLVLNLHLLVNTEIVLHTAIDFRLDSGFLQMPGNFIHNTSDIILAGHLPAVDIVHQLLISLRLQIA